MANVYLWALVILVCGVLILNIVLQILALVALGKATSNADITSSQMMLKASTGIQSLFLVITLSLAAFTLFSSMNTDFLGIAVLVSGVGILALGSISASVASKLQCYRTSDANVYTAWKWTSMTAISGILGAMLMLVIKVLASRRELKQLIGGEKEVEMKAFKPTIPVGLPPPPPYPSAVQICKDACEKKASMPRHKPHYYPPIY